MPRSRSTPPRAALGTRAAYDVTFAYNPRGEWTSQHLMSVNGKFKDIKRADVLTLADRFGIGTAGRVFERVRTAVAQWRRYARIAGVSGKEAERIARCHAAVP